MKGVVTPAANWPVGRWVSLLDAYMRNPVEAKVIRHPNQDHIVAEDARNIVYYARTDRIEGFVERFIDEDLAEFADILG